MHLRTYLGGNYLSTTCNMSNREADSLASKDHLI